MEDINKPNEKNFLLFTWSAKKLFVNFPKPYVTKKIEPIIPTCSGVTTPEPKSGFLITE